MLNLQYFPFQVKIISDVTVPVSKSKPIESETIDQTKSHVSVPTSIATSLGLLDIVVLDDNQQFILHNQSQQTGNNQAEYILPQIDTRNVTGNYQIDIQNFKLSFLYF